MLRFVLTTAVCVRTGKQATYKKRSTVVSSKTPAGSVVRALPRIVLYVR